MDFLNQADHRVIYTDNKDDVTKQAMVQMLRKLST